MNSAPNVGPDNGRWKGGLEPFVNRTKELLEMEPMTRHALQCELGTAQQRVSEVLRMVGAQVVGYEPPPRQGRPSPVYGLVNNDEKKQLNLGRVSSVWDLGARA